MNFPHEFLSLPGIDGSILFFIVCLFTSVSVLYVYVGVCVSEKLEIPDDKNENLKRRVCRAIS